MRFKKFMMFLLIVVLISLTLSCFFPDPNFIISLSEDKKIEQPDTEVFIYEEDSDKTSRAPGSGNDRTKVDFEKSITHKVRILPVQVDGVPVHANDVFIQGNRAYIAYNYAGDMFKGAIQIVDISNPGEPEILTELKFSSMDINTLEMYSSKQLLFGGQADPDQFGFRSFVGSIDLGDLPEVEIEIDIDSIAASIVDLESYATTAIAVQGSSVYVGVGAKDGLIQILNSSLVVDSNIDVPDIRDLQKYSNGIVAIAGTTDNDADNGRVLIYRSNDLDNPIVIDILNFSSDFHKATIEMYNAKYAFLGLSEAGLKVLDITEDENNSEFVFVLENPTASYTTKTNTNSVSTDSNYIFSANGEYGFRVLRVLNMGGKNAAFAEMVGFFPFEGLSEGGLPYSANHIEYKANHLFVASGVGGVNIYYLED